MTEQQVLEPHQQAMSDVDDLAAFLFDAEYMPGRWETCTPVVREAYRGIAVAVLNAGWRRPAAQRLRKDKRVDEWEAAA